MNGSPAPTFPYRGTGSFEPSVAKMCLATACCGMRGQVQITGVADCGSWTGDHCRRIGIETVSVAGRVADESGAVAVPEDGVVGLLTVVRGAQTVLELVQCRSPVIGPQSWVPVILIFAIASE